MAEFYRGWIAPVLAADSYFEVGSGFTPALDSDADQFSDPVTIKNGEGVLFENSLGKIRRQDLVAAVTREAKGRLGESVRTEREELGFLSNLIGDQGSTR